MTHLLSIFQFLTLTTMIICDFNSDYDFTGWQIVDDVVMGGVSDGQLGLNEDGNAVFYGKVSLENNGGFSSIRYNFPTKKVDQYSEIQIRLKGDGKDYQFRVKSDVSERYSYVYQFQTSGEWETISIPLAEMEPRFRGRNLSMPNYPSQILEQIAILISNKKKEEFELQIDLISLH